MSDDLSAEEKLLQSIKDKIKKKIQKDTIEPFKDEEYDMKEKSALNEIMITKIPLTEVVVQKEKIFKKIAGMFKMVLKEIGAKMVKSKVSKIKGFEIDKQFNLVYKQIKTERLFEMESKQLSSIIFYVQRILLIAYYNQLTVLVIRKQDQDELNVSKSNSNTLNTITIDNIVNIVNLDGSDIDLLEKSNNDNINNIYSNLKKVYAEKKEKKKDWELFSDLKYKEVVKVKE